MKAVLGFHEIRDKSTALYLSEYFFSHQEEATGGNMPSIFQWIWLFDDFGVSEGLSFEVNLMQKGSLFNARTAYEKLVEQVNQRVDISPIEDDLKMTAITATDTLKRTWAKVLLNTNEKLEHDQTKKPYDSRLMFRTILDIEVYLHRNLPDKATTVTPELHDNKPPKQN